MILIRLSLGFLLLQTLWVGAWAQFAPKSFYDNFPSFNWSWVSLDGSFNEHLLRDIGGLNLALATVIVFALLDSKPILLRVVSLSTLVYQIPHSLYHFAHLDLLPNTFQQIIQIFSLSSGILASLIIFWQTTKGVLYGPHPKP